MGADRANSDGGGTGVAGSAVTLKIVLPIVLFAVVYGLFLPQDKIQRLRWVVVVWIALVLALYWIKN
jgi:hypothetical protein